MQGKVIVVTGASGALGRTLVKMGRARGARVAAIDFAVTDSLGQADFQRGGVDLSSAEAARAALVEVAEHLGQVDALFNAVGGFIWQTTADGDPAAWERMFRLNLLTTLNACRATLPHLTPYAGCIVNVGAYAALEATTGMGCYAASKAGVHRLTEALAAETQDAGVRVNAVAPTTLDTPANRADMPNADPADWVTLEGLAEVMLFLAGDGAGSLTGAIVPVRGRRQPAD